MTERPTVMFLCVHNAGRSQMALGRFRALAGVPGKRYDDWPLEDPAGKDIETVRRVRDEIEQRVRALLAELGVPAR